jgi:MFS family permease
MSTVARWFTKRRSVMTGIIVAGGSIGSLIAPLVINWLIDISGWRMSYIVIGIVTLLIMVISAQFLIRDPAKKNLLPDGKPKTSDNKAGFTPADTSFTLGKAVRTNQFWLAFLILLSFGYCMVAIKLHIVPHATDIGISPAIAASILAIVGGVSLLGNYLLGSVGDRIGNNRVYVIGAILVAVGLVWLIWAKETWMFCLIAAIFGFAFGGMASTESPLVADLFGLSSHGLIYGTVGLGFTIGASIGPYLTGYIFDVYGSYWLAFLLCAIFAIICMICAALIRSPRKQ